MTLFELTSWHESGIVIYDTGDTFVLNWMAECPGDNELPVLTPLGTVLGWEAEQELHAASTEKIPSWYEYIKARAEELSLLYDFNNDIGRADPYDCPATIYTLDDGTLIIVPEDWN